MNRGHLRENCTMIPFSTDSVSLGRPAICQFLILTGSPRIEKRLALSVCGTFDSISVACQDSTSAVRYSPWCVRTSVYRFPCVGMLVCAFVCVYVCLYSVAWQPKFQRPISLSTSGFGDCKVDRVGRPATEYKLVVRPWESGIRPCISCHFPTV